MSSIQIFTFTFSHITTPQDFQAAACIAVVLNVVRMLVAVCREDDNKEEY